MVRVDKDSRLGAFTLRLAGHLVRWVLLLVGSTCRVEVVAGAETLRRLQESPRPVLLSFWHDRTFLSAYFLYRELHRKGFDITLLASHSRDGEMVTQMVKGWGITTVRGSASRGGTAALRGLHRAIKGRGSSPIMIPDGPRGPAYAFKVGVAVLAQLSGAPILPLGFAARRAWHLKSWDRLVIPKPFTRIAVVVEEPQAVDPDLGGDELEAERLRLEGVLDDVKNRAEGAVP
ncbi:MAG: lysophospholipid acyltransferase family protein [Acidobacteriota bacterium]